jgi:serine/threonine protein kinase
MTDEQSRPPHGDDGNGVPQGSSAGIGAMVCGICGTTYGANMRFCPLDGAVLRAVTEGRSDLIGTIVDSRYHLTRKLGQGGMGDVYLGEHLRTQRQCAVKVISRSQSTDPDALGRFLREATNAGKINHPNVATVYDFGETVEGLFYLAMEFVDGEPLSQVLERERALTAARAAEIARQVAEGVSAAHDVGIVHRDLKPGNILITRDRRNADRVKVVDFGIARAPADEQQNLTRTGTIIGTPEYMSPEQLIGDSVDGRSDIYALGCILFQMVTGEQAFGGPTAQVISRRLTERPPRPREKNATIPQALDDVIVTMLGRTPTERYQSMEAVRDALLEAVPPLHSTTGPRPQVTLAGLLPATVPQPTGEVPAPAAPEEPPAAPITAPRPGMSSPSATGILSAQQFEAGPPADESYIDDLQPPADEELEYAQDDASEPDDVSAVSDAAETAQPVGDIESAPTTPIASATPSWQKPHVSPRRGTSKKKAGLVVASVLALIVVLAMFMIPEPEPQPAPVIVEPAPPPPPPPSPDTAVLAAVWLSIGVADSARVATEFDLALASLLSADSALSPVRFEFAADSAVVQLTDTIAKLLTETKAQCQVARDLRLSRGQPAPECKVE